MAELTFKSAGVSTREIDLSGPTPQQPQGVPAGVIGTSTAGPAFVPLTFGSFTDFRNLFGQTDGKKFGPLAVNEWMKSAKAGTFALFTIIPLDSKDFIALFTTSVVRSISYS